jgi:hypothetical protein
MRERYIATVMVTIEPRARLADADVIELWLCRQRSPLTRSVYLRDIRRLLCSTGRKLADISALDLERFAKILAGSGLAPISQGGRSPPSGASTGSPKRLDIAGMPRRGSNCLERNPLSPNG